MNYRIALVTLCLFSIACVAPRPAAAQDIVGKVIAGYQGWFAAEGDGSPVGNLGPGRGNSHDNLETYPDLREFPNSEQFPAPNDWGNLPNGNRASIFSSDRDFTIQQHVRWMKQYGIDCAAVQRFGEVVDPRSTVNRDQKDDVTLRMMRACQKYGTKFYIEYDASGSGGGGWGADWPTSMEDDWNNFAVADHVDDSTAYAKEDGKPVVEIWGLGLDANNISRDPAKWLAVIQWFKSHGCYVIAGVATGWLGQSKFADALPGFEQDFTQCDAISPWVVGRFRGINGADSYASTNEVPELAWCKAHHITYLPCVYPGTSFFNSNGRTKNIIPREGGELMWAQFVNLRKLGITNCFVSMFDEFNEATAIAKSAETIADVPTGKWFLTMDADGIPLSSDYYLRLTSDGSKMIKGITGLSVTIPTKPFDNLFFASFEPGSVLPTWSDSPDKAYNHSPMNVIGVDAHSSPTCSVQQSQNAEAGTSSLDITGIAHGGAKTYCWYQLYDNKAFQRPIDKDTLLYYWMNPEQDNGRYIGIDILFSDGTTLRSSGDIDQNGYSIDAESGHGTAIPLGKWNVIVSHLGNESGKRIMKLWVVFNRPGATGPYSCSIDDLRITN